MSRYSLILLFFTSLLLVSCASKQEVVPPSQKAFDQEDTYAIFALYAQNKGDYKSASGLYQLLYENSGKKEYLYENIKCLINSKENDKAEKLAKSEILKTPKDDELYRLEISALINQEKYEEAKSESLLLLEFSKTQKDYILTSNVYSKLKDYEMSRRYLESAYNINHDENVLRKLSLVLYLNLNDKKGAIALLETHSRLYGCGDNICSQLASFYSESNNIDGMLNTYLKLYKETGSEDSRIHIIKIYAYKKDYNSLTTFLEKTGTDKEILLKLYINSKSLKKASKTSYELYDDTGDIIYLAQGSIYEYESNEANNKIVKKVIKNLKVVVDELDDPVYLNYLGYLMIDHNVDIKDGMKYVKEALAKSPNSSYYLDSLAWGYYKLSDCKKADKLMKKVVNDLGLEDDELIKHTKAINKCMKN